MEGDLVQEALNPTNEDPKLWLIVVQVRGGGARGAAGCCPWLRGGRGSIQRSGQDTHPRYVGRPPTHPPAHPPPPTPFAFSRLQTGHEREICMQLMQKYINLANADK
jgi:hypothetical protein